MTPGQRWTATLAIAYVVTVLWFGAPARQVFVEEAAAAPEPADALSPRPDAPRESGAVPAPVGDDGPDPPSVASPSVPPVSPAPTGRPSQPVGDTGTPTVALPDPPRVIAIAAPADAVDVPGRGDAAMAAAFLDGASFDATVTTVGPDPAARCAEVAAASDVVIASEGIGAITHCLVASGVHVVAFDERGDDRGDGPGSGGRGHVVSTRRGVEATLLDLGRWGVASGSLRGKVGVVGTTAAEEAIARAVTGLERLGVDVAETAYLGEAPASFAEMSEAVRRFAAAGVEVVVFATDVAHQRQWVGLYSVLRPGARYVVSDVVDGVRDETYPPLFEGALAHTSLRVPWFARDRGETPMQKGCRERWEAHVGGEMRAGETVRVFAWCQHVRLVEAALAAVGPDAPLSDALRVLRVGSPLTSDLGPLPGDRYGPTQDAVLVWRSSCGCWREQRPFAPRAAVR